MIEKAAIRLDGKVSETQVEAHEKASLHLLDRDAFVHPIAFKHARRSVPADKDCGDVSLRYQLIAQEFFCLPRLHRFVRTQKMRRQLADLIIRRAKRYVQDSFRNGNLIADDLASISWRDERDPSPGRFFSTRTVHLLAQERQRDEDALRRFLCATFRHWHTILSGGSHFLLSSNLHELSPELNHDWTKIRRELEKRGLPVQQFRCDELGRVTKGLDVTESLRQLSSQQCNAAALSDAKQRLPLPTLLHQLRLGEHAKTSARCPFHDDQHNSFSVWRSKAGWWLWKCHAGCGEGDEITFLQKYKSISKSTAIKLFKEMANAAFEVGRRIADASQLQSRNNA